MNYTEKSIEVIKKHQSPNGAYVASPSFAVYNYCWLRDGSFIAYAMDTKAEHDSSRAFFDWVNHAVSGISGNLTDLLGKLEAGELVGADKFPPARFKLDGSLDESDWPNFQIDGYGIWLWALSEHLKMTGCSAVPDEYLANVQLVVEYLKKCWGHECYDCWEENGDKIHTSTLGCIYGGLKSINQFLGDRSVSNTVDLIRLFITNYCTYNDSLVKHMGSHEVDANLIWLMVPFNVFSANSVYAAETIRRIEQELTHSCGVHRYREDTYYGGGEWLLLSAWLGWYYAKCGRIQDAILQKKWVEAQAEGDGSMPEQVLYHTNCPARISYWREMWSDVACPLLWSHAMYLVLDDALGALK